MTHSANEAIQDVPLATRFQLVKVWLTKQA